MISRNTSRIVRQLVKEEEQPINGDLSIQLGPWELNLRGELWKSVWNTYFSIISAKGQVRWDIYTLILVIGWWILQRGINFAAFLASCGGRQKDF